MKLKSYILVQLIIFSMLIISCKSNKVTSEEENKYEFHLLMKENYQPKELTAIQKFDLETAKRTSRGSNLWYVIYLSREVSDEKLFKKLLANNLVEEVTRLVKNQPLNPPENLKIRKSGKTNPIKNR